MKLLSENLFCLIVALSTLLSITGCSKSPSKKKQNKKPQTTQKNTNNKTDDKEQTENQSPIQRSEKYPDVPIIPIMTEVDGIPIPRVASKAQSLTIKGPLPVDVGNEAANPNRDKPVTGGELIVRFGAEPDSLNPVIESSAVQTYIGSYVNEMLVRQNPETLEYEPWLAKKWTVEDSIKLSADYPGKERRLKGKDDKLLKSTTFSYTALTNEQKKNKKKPQVINFTTTDLSGKNLGIVWVGLFAAEGTTIPGFSAKGEHYWSDESGKVSLSGLKTGKYQIHVGAELVGTTTENEDGSLVVTPLTDDNPLQAELKSSKKKSLAIAKKDWLNVQRQTIYTYFLNEDAKWSDGKPFTSKDLEFSYAILHNEFVDGDSLKVYYSDVIACEGISPHTLRIQYRQQYFKSFEFTYGLAAYTAPYHKFEEYIKKEFKKDLTLDQLTPKEEDQQKKISALGQRFGKYFNINDTYNDTPLGTGPYIVKKWIRKDSVIIERNPNYWGTTHRGYLDRMIFKFISDSSTSMQALKAGEIDFFWQVTPPQYYETLAGPPKWFKGKYVKASWFTPGFSYVGWNMLKPKFQDKRVRLALALLFDVEYFLEKKLHGDGVLVSGSQYYFGIGYDHSVKPIGYDLETANELLAEAGWVDTDNDGIIDKDGEKFEFDFLFPPGSKVVEEQVAMIQKAYKSAGIVMNPQRLEWASFIAKIKAKEFDVCRLGWATPLESDPFQIWHGSEAGKNKRGSNHVSFSNQEADRLIEMLRYTLDQEKREQIHFAFQRILDREQPYLFLYTAKTYGAYHQKFRGVKWYRQRPGFDFSEWYIPKHLQKKK